MLVCDFMPLLGPEENVYKKLFECTWVSFTFKNKQNLFRCDRRACRNTIKDLFTSYTLMKFAQQNIFDTINGKLVKCSMPLSKIKRRINYL